MPTLARVIRRVIRTLRVGPQASIHWFMWVLFLNHVCYVNIKLASWLINLYIPWHIEGYVDNSNILVGVYSPVQYLLHSILI